MKKKVCMYVCIRVKGHRSKKHFLCLSAFALDLEETWSRLRRKLKKTSISSGFKRHSTVKNALYTSEYHAQKM
jgi:hypothetical protein